MVQNEEDGSQQERSRLTEKTADVNSSPELLTRAPVGFTPPATLQGDSIYPKTLYKRATLKM